MTPIPLPVSDIPTLWWWVVTPGVVLAASAGVLMRRIEQRMSAARPARRPAELAQPGADRVPAREPAAAAA